MEKLKELFEIIDFHYGDLVDLRNRISIDGDDTIYNEDHLSLDHILDIFDELKEKESK